MLESVLHTEMSIVNPAITYIPPCWTGLEQDVDLPTREGGVSLPGQDTTDEESVFVLLWTLDVVW